jgi:transcriptional regulator with XRE-family HTH domain
MPPDALLQRYPGETLRWLRGRLGLTQRAFAARIGADPKSVSRWEAGRARISLPMHRRIVPLLAQHLATPEGDGFARTLYGVGGVPEGLPYG